MNRLIAFLCLALPIAFPLGAKAQGFVDEPTCYNWEGGHKSAGSFSKCGPRWVVAAKPTGHPSSCSTLSRACQTDLSCHRQLACF